MLDFLQDNKKHTICLVGGGGKTTLLYELAEHFAAQGRRVLVLTSTHILQPDAAFYAENAADARALWQRGSYAVIGTPEPASGKLTLPPAALYAELWRQADVILCEADGAKRLPCKLPAAHEPVLLPECDIVLAVAGADALGRALGEVCFRFELAQGWLTEAGSDVKVDAELLSCLLTDERGARKNVGGRAYYVILNKCDTITEELAQRVRTALLGRGLAVERIWLRGRKK